MENPAALIFLALFALSLFALYISIRRGLGKIAPTVTIGVVANAIFFTLFGVARATEPSQAVLIGFILGGGFTLTAAAIAMFFRNNEQRQPPRHQ
jgi:O-antigen/teichoic acid export membrane protein